MSHMESILNEKTRDICWWYPPVKLRFFFNKTLLIHKLSNFKENAEVHLTNPLPFFKICYVKWDIVVVGVEYNKAINELLFSFLYSQFLSWHIYLN